MIINANTKIASILKHNAEALEAIISITPKFEKLRNPLLRKLMAGRTSLAMASKISGCGLEAFYTRLKPLGFEIDKVCVPVNEEKPHLPAFFNSLKPEDIEALDVRPVIEAGEDPLSLIVKKVKTILPGKALKIINSFEPTPLLSLLQKQGFTYYVDVIDDNEVDTYFYKTGTQTIREENQAGAGEGWNAYLARFKDHLIKVDVRALPMPQPMLTILAVLETLPANKALFVYHKKIPVFLLPELKDKGFDFRIKEISEDQVHLLIFKE